MKKFLMIAIIAVASMTFAAQEAQARFKIGYSNGPATQSIITAEEPFMVDNKGYNEFGIIFEQFSIMGVPIWNYGEPTYAFYNEYNLSIDYVEGSVEDFPYLREEFGVDFKDKPSLSFWNKIGGKLVLLLVIGAIIAYYAMKSDDDDEEEESK